MIYGIAYVEKKQGKKYWSQYLNFHKLTPIEVPTGSLSLIREDLGKNYKDDYLDEDKYLIEGVHIKFITPLFIKSAEMLLDIRANSQEAIQGLAKKLNLPFNKPNLSEEGTLLSISAGKSQAYSKLDPSVPK